MRISFSIPQSLNISQADLTKTAGIVGNGILTGCAAGLIFGSPLIGVICAVAQVTLAVYNYADTQGFFFPLTAKALTDVDRDLKPFFKAWISAVTVGFVFNLVIHGAMAYFGFNQLVVQLFNEIALDLPSLLGFFTLVAVVVPIVEEVFFRGFLQGSCRDFQILYLGKEAAEETSAKVNRVMLQATVFSACHLSTAQNIGTNLILLPLMWLAGLNLGGAKERTGHLWASTVEHGWCNGTVLFFSSLTKLMSAQLQILTSPQQ